MTPYSRFLLASAVLALLPLAGTHAQSAAVLDPWAQCELDPLARFIITPAPDTPPPEQQPIQVEAQQIESSPTESRLQGDVQLSHSDQRLRAEKIILERPSNQVRTEGEFTYGNQRRALRGQRAEINLDSQTGQFWATDYYLPERHAQGHAEEVRVDRTQQVTWLEDASYSTCTRGRESWELRARALRLDEATGRGEARDIKLAFLNHVLVYFPYLSFPITDARQSGFLLPQQGFAKSTGLDLQAPYYWNIAPNRDMTITPRLMSERGLMLGAEYRFLQPWHQGRLRFEYIPYDRRYEGQRGSVNIQDRAEPLPHLYTDLLYEYVSDLNYLRDLNNNLSFLSANYLERHLDVRYEGETWWGLARLQGYQILSPSLFSLTGKPYQRLPQLLFNGNWPVWGETSGLQAQLRSEFVRFEQSGLVTGNRLDLWPTLSWNLEKPWGYIKPALGFRYTLYQLDGVAAGADDAPTRAAPVVSLDSGLFFERHLQADWLGIAAGTQTLEPRLFYLYVPYRNQDALPLFDSALMDRDYDGLFRPNRFVGGDRLGDAHQVTAALTTRLIDGSSGRERLRASLGQTQYFADRRVRLQPGQLPETADNSGLIAQAQLNLATRWSLRGGVQMEPDNQDLLRGAFELRYYLNPRHLINVSYLLDHDQPGLALDEQIHAVDVSFFWPISTQWRVLGRWNYALNSNRNLETLAGLEYEDCCWALRLAARQYRDSPSDQETQNAFYAELELKGLSRLGSGLETLLQNSIFGYQPTRY